MRNYLIRLLFTISVLAYLPVFAAAQNVRVDNIVLSARGTPIGGASVAVCGQPATLTTTPCTPLIALCSSLTDTVCTSPNPVSTDGLGNYHFYVSIGTIYTVQYYGSGLPVAPNAVAYTDQRAGGGGASGSPGGSTGAVQVNSNGVFAASSATDDAAGFHFKGPNPWVDPTRYGARSLPFGTNPASTTATCTASSTTVTLVANTGGQFLNGDSIRLDGCGPTSTVPAPTGVAVSPGMNAGGSMSVSAANMGTTTYNYRVIACDASGGCSAASPIMSTTTGAATLGRVTATISTMSLVNNTVTVTTTAAHGFIVGAVVTIVPFTTSPAAPAFEGTFVVGSVPTSTTFTFTSSQDSRVPGTVTSATGGTVAGFNCNVISWTQPATIPWKYYVYSNRGGAGYVLVWQGMASNIGPGMAAQDYGSPMMDTQVFNSWVPTTPPTVATNDYLVTTVSSGGGTTSIVVANAPTNSNTGGTAQMGSDVSIINAAAAAKFGTLYIPTGTFWTAGLVDLSPDTPLHVLQAGQINNTDTLRLPGSLEWDGWGANNPVSFSWTSMPLIQGVNGAYPVLYFKNVGTVTFNRVQPASNSTNGNLLFYADDPLAINPPTNYTFNYVNWVVGTGGLTNYMGMIGIFTGGGFSYTFDHNTFSGAQAPTGLLGDVGQTFLPGWSFTNSKISPYTCTAGYAARNSWFVGRSSFEQNVSTNLGAATGCIPEQIFEFNQTQNLDVPLYITTGPFTGNSQASVTMRDIYAADFPVAMVGNFSNQLSGIQVFAHGAVGSGITGGHSAYTGGPVVVSTNANQQINAPLPGAGTSGGTNGGNNANNSVGFYVSGGTGGVGTLLPPPAAPALAAGAGTLIPVGTHTFAVQWVDNFGHFSPMGATASITLVANTQNVTVTPPTPPAGAVGYVIQMDGSGIQATSGGSCFATYTPASAANVPGASSGCANTGGQQFWASTGTNAVASGVLPTTLTASQMQIVNGFVLTLAAPGGGFTANRTATIPDNTGTVAETNLAQTWSATQTFSGAPGITEQNAGGTFTTGQEYLQSLLNSCNPQIEFGATQAGGVVVDALTGCVAIPAGATRQGNAVAGYATSLSNSAVGGYFQARPLANNVFADGANNVWQDVIGLTTGVSGNATDVNVNPQNASTAYVNGGPSGVNVALGARLAGTYGNAFQAGIFGATLGQWSTSYVSNNAATGNAFVAGTSTSATPSASQNFLFNHRDSGGVVRQAGFYVDTLGRFTPNFFSADIHIQQNPGVDKAILAFSANTAQRTYTFQDSSDTIVGRATTDTLTNKTNYFGIASLAAQTASVVTANLVASAPIGEYLIQIYMPSTVTCATPGPAQVVLTLGWTDETGARTQTFTQALGTTTGLTNTQIPVWVNAAANITYATTLTACTTGAATYALRLSAAKVQ